MCIVACMKIIAVLNEKGGTGKSTVSTNIATALHRSGKKVVLVDADPQGTARDWREASPQGADLPPVVGLDRPQLLQQALPTLQGNDFLIIDSPAKAEAMAAAIVKIANVALIVIQPSGADIWASAATVKLVQSKIDVGGSIDAAFLVNRASGSTKLSKQVLGGDWNEYGFSQLDSTIGNRVSFAQALTDGVSVYDLADGQAKAEIDLVLQELEAAKWV
jgi:chromosome partitioning protein